MTTRAAQHQHTSRRPAAVAAAGFAGIAGFEIALALGAPLGRAAFGGAHADLSTGLRIAAAFSACLWLVAALVVLRRGGYDWSPIPARAAWYGTWVLVGLQALGALMNLASRSNWERFIWTPISLTMVALCIIVTRGPTSVSESRKAP